MYVDGNFHNKWAIPSPGSAVLQLTYLSAPRSQDTRDQFQKLVGISQETSMIIPWNTKYIKIHLNLSFRSRPPPGSS